MVVGRFLVFFFFQAEDGIRDWSVTGVQTCALPISSARPRGTGGTRTSGCADTRSSSIPTALGNLRLDLSAKEAIRLATSNNRVDVSKYRSPRFHSRRTDSSCLLAEARLLACTSVARFR